MVRGATKEPSMSVAKIIEVSASSSVSVEDELATADKFDPKYLGRIVD